METKHIVEVLMIIIFLVMLTLAFKGWGQFVIKTMRLDLSNNNLSIDLWLGILILIGLTEFIHYFIAIDWKVSIPIFMFGIGYFLFNNKDNTIYYKENIKLILSKYLVLKLFILFIIFTALSISIQPIWLGDAGLYHLQTIKSINDYPILPGLGNIHSRLAFNQSYFTLIGLINFYPFGNFSYQVFNLYLLCLATIVIYRVCNSLNSYGKELFIILTVTFASILQQPLNPSPDLTIGIYQSLIFLVLIKIIQTSNEKIDLLYKYIMLLLILCITSLSIKISAVIFVLASTMVVFNKIKLIFLLKYNQLIKIFLICGLVLSVHQLRGYFLSGYPFYPSQIAGTQLFDWSMPISSLINEKEWIYSWARLPGAMPSEVLANWNWIEPWFKELPQKGWLPVATSIVLSVFIYLLNSDANATKLKKSLLPLYAVLISSIIFWFFTAPDVRFLGAVPGLLFTLSIWIFYQIYIFKMHNFYINYKLLCKFLFLFFIILMLAHLLKMGTGLGILSFLGISKIIFDMSQVGINITLIIIIGFLFCIYSLSIKEDKNKIQKITYILLLSILWIVVISMTAKYMNFNSIVFKGIQLIPDINILTKTTSSGLKVNTPEKGEACWNAQIPCTPIFNEDLKIWESKIKIFNNRFGFSIK